MELLSNRSRFTGQTFAEFTIEPFAEGCPESSGEHHLQRRLHWRWFDTFHEGTRHHHDLYMDSSRLDRYSRRALLQSVESRSETVRQSRLVRRSPHVDELRGNAHRYCVRSHPILQEGPMDIEEQRSRIHAFHRWSHRHYLRHDSAFHGLISMQSRWQIPFHLQLCPCYSGLECLHPLHHRHLSGHVLHTIQLSNVERVDHSPRMVLLVTCGLCPLRNHRSVFSTTCVVGNWIELLRSERLSSECSRKDRRDEDAVSYSTRSYQDTSSLTACVRCCWISIGTRYSYRTVIEAIHGLWTTLNRCFVPYQFNLWNQSVRSLSTTYFRIINDA